MVLGMPPKSCLVLKCSETHFPWRLLPNALLVGGDWNHGILFSPIVGMMIQSDELICFMMVIAPPTRLSLIDISYFSSKLNGSAVSLSTKPGLTVLSTLWNQARRGAFCWEQRDHMALVAFRRYLVNINLPSAKHLHSYGTSQFSSWENQLFLWPFSIAMFNYQQFATENGHV